MGRKLILSGGAKLVVVVAEGGGRGRVSWNLGGRVVVVLLRVFLSCLLLI